MSLRKFNDPFEENPFTEQLDRELTTGFPQEISCGEYLARLVEIEDELVRVGAKRLLADRDALKDALKARMMKELIDHVVDEVSDYEAMLVVRTTDAWDVEKTKSAMTVKQRTRYVIEQIDAKLVAEGIKIGDLSRAALEVAGAVTRVPKDVALTVRPRKGLGL